MAPGRYHRRMDVTLVTAHPVEGSFSNALGAAWAAGARGAGATVHAFDATRLRFDPVLRHVYQQRMPDEPDLARLRSAIAASTVVTWAFPTWWAGLPAALKGLVDRLFLPRESFVFEGRALPRGLLAGRSSRYVATMDSPAWWYALAHHAALEGSFGRGTLRFVGFAPVRRTVVHRVRALDAAARARWLDTLRATGARDVEDAARRAG